MTEYSGTNPCFEHMTPTGEVIKVDDQPPEECDPLELDATDQDGSRLSYTKSGDKVVWPSDEEFPVLLRRNDSVIHAMMRELAEKVWWDHHQNRARAIARGEEKLTKEELPFFAEGAHVAKKIEDKYGRENLRLSDFEWCLLSGRLSALRWVMSYEWNDSLDV